MKMSTCSKVASLLAALLFAVKCKAEVCPEGFIGYVNDPTDCRAFFICAPGQPASHGECSWGLYFNPVNRRCDFPNNVVDCRGVDFVCPHGFVGTVRDPDNCESFYVCKNGQASQQTCVSGQHFNPITEICDSPENVTDCQSETSPSGTDYYLSTTTAMMDDFCPLELYGYIGDPSDCRSFFQCASGKSIRQLSCPIGLYFNPIQQVCDFPENVPNCQDGMASAFSNLPVSDTMNNVHNDIDL